MKGLVPLFLGIFGTFAFSWVGLTVIPNWQIGHLNPQMEEDGTDVYPQPQSGMVERGARVTLRTAAIIVTASKCAPSTRRPILSGNGAIAVARREITFLNDRFFLGKCVWVRTWRISARARRPNRKTRLGRPPEAQLLRVHPGNSQQSRLYPALLGLGPAQIRRQKVPVLPRQMHCLP